MRDESEKPPHVRFDWDRQARTGMAEAVLCQGKTCANLSEILTEAKARQANLLLTRLSSEMHTEISADHHLNYCALSRTAIFGAMPTLRETGLGVALVCAGTSDLDVLTEAQRTLDFNGIPNKVFADVGVAGLWRIMSVAEELSQYRVLIAVAGMEGALFSVLAGLVSGLVIAVPSSVGYGVSADGKAALSSALSSCSPGLVTVNIDNGFGAAAAAIKLLRQGTPDSTSAECQDNRL
ncbi:nickel pincer cofactor biosynthesis protein LarB [Loktanella sp. SALINAS62]|nr:nickel pincer cofactor biosynthesis protein LarB [Loktanella sp. SALINAS62]